MKKFPLVLFFSILVWTGMAAKVLAQNENHKKVNDYLFSQAETGVEITETELKNFKKKIQKVLDRHLYFHGTLAEYLPGIHQEGLIAHKKVGATRDLSWDLCVANNVYFTRSFSDAEYFANWAVLNKEIREEKVGKINMDKIKGFIAFITDFSDHTDLSPKKFTIDKETKGNEAFKYLGGIPAFLIFNPFASPLSENGGMLKLVEGLRKKTGIKEIYLSTPKLLTLTHEIIKEKILEVQGKLAYQRAYWINTNIQ